MRSEGFVSHKIIGNVVNEVRRYNEWDIDELIYIDISRERIYNSGRDDHKIKRVKSIDEILELVSKECFMPLSFGGGIRDFETIQKYLMKGADKVVLNTIIHTNPKVVEKAVSVFGSQAIIASLDYKIENNEPTFYSEFGTKRLPYKNMSEIVRFVENLGCGEIFFNSIDRDGSGEGYDLSNIQKLVEMTDLPVIACGGAMETFDFIEASSIRELSGIAAGNMFHFTENVYPRSKNKLRDKELNFR